MGVRHSSGSSLTPQKAELHVPPSVSSPDSCQLSGACFGLLDYSLSAIYRYHRILLTFI